MNVSVDGKEIFKINETKLKVIGNDIEDEKLMADLARRLEWVIMERYRISFKNLKQEWEKKLAQRGVDMIPTDADKFAELVFEQPDYKSKSQRLAVSK